MTIIREIMTTPAFGISADATLAEAIALLTERHVGGAPVIAADNQILGVISELALIDVVFDAATKDACVSRYMTREIQTLHPHETLVRAAQLFALFSFRRLPVVDDGKLVGIVSRRDLMNYALRTGEILRDPLLELIPELAEVS